MGYPNANGEGKKLNFTVLSRLGLPIIVAAVGFTVFPVPSWATRAIRPPAPATRRAPVPQLQVQSRPPSVWHPTRIGPHVFYGMIAAINGATIRVRLRSGLFQDVDAAAAIANGDYSAPLFVGKLVSVDGYLSGGRFIATHVFRMAKLTGVRADR